MKDIKYFDYAATTPMCNKAVEKIKVLMETNYGNPSSSYSLGRQAKSIIEIAREKVANYIGASSNQVIFTSCATEANNMVIQSIAKNNKGGHIITSKIEHSSVLETCRELEKNGYSITYLDVDKNGLVSPQELLGAIKSNTVLISIMYVNNEIGTVQPIKEISEMAKSRGILFHTDAVQAIGKIDLNLSKLNCDFLTFSGHKIYASKGVGILYVRNIVDIDNLIHGGKQEFGIRSGTENVLAIASLGEAIDYLSGIENDFANSMKDLQEYALRLIRSKLDGYILNGSFENRVCNNINISFKDIDAESLLIMLDLEGICVSSGSACHSGDLSASHVLQAIDVDKDYISGTLRITFGNKTTKKDVAFLINKIKEKVDFIRNM